MEYTIKTDPRIYFRQMLDLLDFLPVYHGISPREKDVLAEILLYSWVYRHLSKADRWSIITSMDVKEKIRLKIGLSKAALANMFAIMRKKGIITFTGIDDKYLFSPESSLIIHFEKNAD